MVETEMRSPRLRRAFLELHEIPGLWRGTAVADAAAVRRVLGARRGGRVGFALALTALWLAAPSLSAALVLVIAHVSLGLVLGLANRRRGGHTTREVQRIALWTVLTPLCIAALVSHTAAALGASGGEQLGLLLLGVSAGQVALWRALAVSGR
jgi:hypothetical protein